MQTPADAATFELIESARFMKSGQVLDSHVDPGRTRHCPGRTATAKMFSLFA